MTATTRALNSAPSVAASRPDPRSATRRAPPRLRISPLHVGLFLTAAIALGAIATPLDPFSQTPALRLLAPTTHHPLGTDTFGRDVLARLLYAARVSLTVGIVAVALGGTLGSLIGLLAGYAQQRMAEQVLMRLTDILMSFPSLLLGLTVLAVLGPGLDRLILAIGIVLAAPFARVVHATTLALRSRDFVAAAHAIGASHPRILLKHLLPNLAGEIIVLASLLTASAIRIEASLSFIGLGVSPPTPTWGNMIKDGAPVLLSAPWLSVAPGALILLTVIAFNLIGDALRDALDPRTR